MTTATTVPPPGQPAATPTAAHESFVNQARLVNIAAEKALPTGDPRCHLIAIPSADWGRAAALAKQLGYRWAALWADPVHADTHTVYALVTLAGDYLLLHTRVAGHQGQLPSHAQSYPAANRLERHCADLLGIVFDNQPDGRPWVRHGAWPADVHPLLPDYPAKGAPAASTPPDDGYPFVTVQGGGVLEIPVGPVHAGIIEPGHFRFQAVGEQVLAMEEHLGYLHKGIEKRAVGRDPGGLARLAARVSGDSTVAHTWAACQAMEGATDCQPPQRALVLRALMLERERIANHLGDIGAICNDVGFAFVHQQCAGLRETWLRRNGELWGHRLLMDVIVPGGIAGEPDAQALLALPQDLAVLRRELTTLTDIIQDTPSLEDRLLGTGRLSNASADELGTPGYVGRASGIDGDLRRDHPWAPYGDLDIAVACRPEGDVLARLLVRLDEIFAAMDLITQLLSLAAAEPNGGLVRALPEPAENSWGLGLIEGWRGEIATFVRFGQGGRVERFFPRDPSWFLWPALERIVMGNIVPDFPVCNKSVNASYAGCDL